MLQQSVSTGAENALDPCFRKKSGSGKSKGLKNRAKALNDVKNTIHSHASNLVEKSQKDGEKMKNSTRIGIGKSTRINRGFDVSGDENKSIVDSSQPEFACINHFICEKANNFYEAEFFDECKLTKKELECFGNRNKFFSIDPVPFKIRSISPVEAVELSLTDDPPIFNDHEDDIIENISIEVPEPLYF